MDYNHILSRDLSNIDLNMPKKSDLTKFILPEQLERVSRTIGDWRAAVEMAEDIDSPQRIELFQMYRDFIDDYQIFTAMQTRRNKATSGGFKILSQSGDIDIEEQRKFLDPQGFPLAWFRNFMQIVIDSKFYGYEIVQLGPIVDDKFRWVKKIPEENLIPYHHSVLKSTNYGYYPERKNNFKANSIDIRKEPYRTWCIGIGSETDLGLINKCAPYAIYKDVFGSWAQHADLFGMPLRIGKTDLHDNDRRQNMIDMLSQMEGATYGIFDPNDMIEFIEQKGSSDPHNIYGKLIDKCDSGIAKIILGQTSTTDEKAYSGSAEIHQDILDDIIFADKLDISAVINDELIPRMKRLGMISADKEVFATWDFAEKISVLQWSKIIDEIGDKYEIPADQVKKLIGIEVYDREEENPDQHSREMIKERKDDINEQAKEERKSGNTDE